MDATRIEQFRKMVEADPENELGQFSLGKALLDADRPADAIPCLERVTELNMQNSKAYHLLATAQARAGQARDAILTCRLGFDIAHGRGDLKPRNDIAQLMRELGEEPPTVEDPAPSASGPSPAVGEGEITCARCSQAKPALAKPPFKGPLGQQILDNVCADCWKEWIFTGTKVINELRLDFGNPEHSEIYDQHMKEFLNLA